MRPICITTKLTIRRHTVCPWSFVGLLIVAKFPSAQLYSFYQVAAFLEVYIWSITFLVPSICTVSCYIDICKTDIQTMHVYGGIVFQEVTFTIATIRWQGDYLLIIGCFWNVSPTGTSTSYGSGFTITFPATEPVRISVISSSSGIFPTVYSLSFHYIRIPANAYFCARPQSSEAIITVVSVWWYEVPTFFFDCRQACGWWLQLAKIWSEAC